jgi:hypothetical protein
MGVIKANFQKPQVRPQVVAAQFNLEISYVEVLQNLNNFLSNVCESRKDLNEPEITELCRRLRVAGEEWLADSISQ